MHPRPLKPFSLSRLSRREFLYWTALAAAGSALAGCAVNPVTGESQLMLLSREQEIGIDREKSPHQLSADYGPVRDQGLKSYVNSTGQRLAALSHRPEMPYSFQPVNAVYVNAYAFPGGSIAATRGILLEMDNEAQLAALLGHELGHVTARHTAQQMSRGMLTSLVISGLGAGLSIADQGQYAGLVTGLGGIGAGALLAHYSREHERQADALGMEYMTKAGYSPEGMVGLMDLLRQKSKRQPSALETMFSTHPMSSERYATARERARNQYASALNNPLFRDRYQDRTAGLRRIGPAIRKMQEGEKLMAQQKYEAAEAAFAEALDRAPNDYAGLVLQGKCLLAQKKHAQAERVLARAKEVYPQEAQAYHFAGVNHILRQDFDAAAKNFQGYERLLPGNPITDFLQGLAYEGMGRKQNAAEKYIAFLKQVNQGEQAKYAYARLKQWGFVR